jgi:hypothetical protein
MKMLRKRSWQPIVEDDRYHEEKGYAPDSKGVEIRFANVEVYNVR